MAEDNLYKVEAELGKTYDTGNGWVHRWFAKPLSSGSIPARVSIYLDALDVPRFNLFRNQRRFWFGQMVALWVLRAPIGKRRHKTFRAGLLYPIETVKARSVYTSDLYKKVEKQASQMREYQTKAESYKQQAIEARKALSEYKRMNK